MYKRQIEGRQGIEQERYLTITIERKNFEEAKAQFATLEATIHKLSLIHIFLVGAVLAGYLGYLINGAWTEGIAFNEFMDRFNEVCAVPLPTITIPIQ